MMTREDARSLVERAAAGDAEAKGEVTGVVTRARKGDAEAVHDARLLAEAQRMMVRENHVSHYGSFQRGNGESGGPVNWGQHRGGA